MSPVADSRWRVLPLGRAATLRRAAGEGLLFALVGLAGLFVAAVLSAVIIGEVFPETAVGTTIDLVVRASLVGILVLGALGLLVHGLLGSLHGPLCARALAAARLRGTPATSVPIPTQWKAARENSAGRYKRIAIVLLAILGISYLILVASMLGSGLDAVDLGILVGGGLLLALVWAGIPLTGKMLPRWQARLSEQLPEHWTQAHRIVAAGHELTEEDIAAARAAAEEPWSDPGHGVRILSGALAAIIALASMTWVMLFEFVLVIAYPKTTRYGNRQLGDRRDLAPETEHLVDLLTMASGVVAVVGALAVAGVVVCTTILRRLEHRTLRRALAEPDAMPPPHPLLRRAMAPTSLMILKVLFAFCGAGAALGIALWFVDAVADHPDWDHYAGAGPELRAAGELGPWIVLGTLTVMLLGILVSSALDARDQVLRDELVQRWPVRPRNDV